MGEPKQAAKPVIGFRAEYREDCKPNFLKKSYLYDRAAFDPARAVRCTP